MCSAGKAKYLCWQVLFFLLLNPRFGFYPSQFLGLILLCAYIICQDGQILIPCTIPSGSTFHLLSGMPFVLVWWICLLCISSLSQHDSCVYYQFFLWHSWFLWHFFMLLWIKILFFSLDFLFMCVISLICRLKYPYSCFLFSMRQFMPFNKRVIANKIGVMF